MVTITLKANVHGEFSIRLLDRPESTFTDATSAASRGGSRLPDLLEFILTFRDSADLYGQCYDHRLWLDDEPGRLIHGYCRIDWDEGAISSVKDWKGVHVNDRLWIADYESRPMLLYIGRLPASLRGVSQRNFTVHSSSTFNSTASVAIITTSAMVEESLSKGRAALARLKRESQETI